HKGEAAGGHQREKPDGLQRDGLAAGLRTGDDEHAELAAELHVYPHDVPLLDQQGVACVYEIEDPFGVQRGPACLERVGKERFRDRQIEASERLQHGVEVICGTLDTTGELVEDALDLGVLGELGFAKDVVRFHDLERLDED